MAETKMELLRKSLNCLYLATDKAVADDVLTNVNAALAERDTAVSELARAAEAVLPRPEYELKLQNESGLTSLNLMVEVKELSEALAAYKAVKNV